MATRWGICGTGKICQDFTTALSTQPQSQLKAVAVAARQLDRAQAFAKDYDIPKAYGSYKELSQDPDVDVVYIGTIHPAHHEQAMLFLNAGKHVLVEKVVAMNSKQLKEMTGLAREKKLFFMEAVWTRFFPAFKKVLEELRSGAIGEPRILTANFCKPAKNVPRIHDKSLGGGGLLDLGVYPLNVATFLFGKPDSVTVEGTFYENYDVDEASCIIFKYKDGRMAQLFYSIQFDGTNELYIFGTNGRIQVHNPMWCPTELTLPSGKLTFDLPKTERTFNFDNSAGLAYEALHTRECIQQGLTESPILPMSHSETVMEIIDQIKRNIGLHYDVDD